MAIDVTVPKFGLMMQEAILTNWYKQVGERVTEGEPLFSIETEKVNTDVEAPVGGVLTQIMADVGDTVAVAATIAIIDTQA